MSKPDPYQVRDVDANERWVRGCDDRSGEVYVLHQWGSGPGDGARAPPSNDAVRVERHGNRIGRDGVRAIQENGGAHDARALIQKKIEPEQELRAFALCPEREDPGQLAAGGGGAAPENGNARGPNDHAARS